MKIGLIEVFPGQGGGNIYQKYIVRALREHYEVVVFRADTHPVLGFRPGRIYSSASIFRSHPEINLWISTYLSTIALNFSRPKGKLISLFYHLDDTVNPNPILSWGLQESYFRQLRKCAGIVTISQYWRNFLEEKKMPVTDVIYWGFNIHDFQFSKDEIWAFKKKYGLIDKPIVCLGNCQEQKGVIEAYEQLKNFDAHLVTTGVEKVKIPARNLCLDYKEYLLLLASSDVVLTLSKFKEGWNGTAHEALLAGTPVIGSGLGGMYELLEQARQPICTNMSDLPNLVTYVFENNGILSENGRRFAEKFTIERFEDSWLTLVKEFL